jgi:hypoxanthine phosphoribosyltransferase
MTSKINLSWESIEQDISLLVERVKDFHPTCILGIANGGMIPAALLAKKLKVDKLLSCNLKSYQDDAPRKGRVNEREGSNS